MFQSQHKILRFLSFMMIFTTYLPIVYVNLPRYIAGHNLWAPIWLTAVVIFSPKILKDKSIQFLILYYGIVIFLLFNTLWANMPDWNKRAPYKELYQFSIAISMIIYFVEAKDYKWLATIAKISIIFIGITAIVTFYVSAIDPLYARSISFATSDDAQELRQLGGGSVGFAGLLICLFPVIIYYYHFNRLIGLSKIVILSFGVLCFIALLRIQIFANILIGSLIILISLGGKRNVKTSIISSSLILILLALIPIHIYSDFFMSMSQYFSPDSDIYGKLVDLSRYLESNAKFEGTQGIAGRASRYPVMINLFLSNPLFGYSLSNNVIYTYGGEHLFWINKLAVFGLLGFVPYVYLFYYHSKRIYNIMNKQYRFYYLVSLFSIVILGFMKVLAGRELWFGIFFVVPVLQYLPLAFKRGRPDLVK